VGGPFPSAGVVFSHFETTRAQRGYRVRRSDQAITWINVAGKRLPHSVEATAARWCNHALSSNHALSLSGSRTGGMIQSWILPTIRAFLKHRTLHALCYVTILPTYGLRMSLETKWQINRTLSTTVNGAVERGYHEARPNVLLGLLGSCGIRNQSRCRGRPLLRACTKPKGQAPSEMEEQFGNL
jgi:hypothetical protein